MDLNIWKDVPYDSWHVVLCQLTAFLSAMLALLCTRTILVKLGFFRSESPSFSFGFSRVIVGAQVAVVSIFLYALILSFGAVVNPPAEKALWTDYNCKVSAWSIALNVTFVVITVALSLRSASLSPREDRDEKQVRQGTLAGWLLLLAWMSITVSEVLLVGGEGERYKILFPVTGLLALVGFLFGTTRKSPLASRFGMGLSLILAMSMFTEVLAHSLALRYTIPQVQGRLEGICRTIEAQQMSADGLRIVDPGTLIPGSSAWGYWQEDHCELFILGGANVSYWYSSKTKKWSARVSLLWA